MRNVCARALFNRRKVLISLIGSVPVTALSIGRSAAVGGSPTAPKIAQSAAHYQDTPKEGQACAACYSFIAPNHCSFLEGEISPSGWCRLWKAKPDNQEAAPFPARRRSAGDQDAGRAARFATLNAGKSMPHP